MLISSLLSVFGLVIAHRTLRTAENLALLGSHHHFFKTFLIFGTVVVTQFLFQSEILMLFAFQMLILLVPTIAISLLNQRRIRIFRSQTIAILDELILGVSSGQSLRQTLHKCGQHREIWVQKVLKDFISSLEMKKDCQKLSEDRRIRRFFAELVEIDTSGVKFLERLRSFRRTWAMEEQFRQRSRQSLLQVRMQSWVMLALFILVLIVSIHFLNALQYPMLILVSSVWCLMGLIWVQRMGRSYKWKI